MVLNTGLLDWESSALTTRQQQINKANLQDREQLLKEKKKGTATNIPLSLKYNRTLPKIKEIVMKHWHLLHINPNLVEIFQNPPILSTFTSIII